MDESKAIELYNFFVKEGYDVNTQEVFINGLKNSDKAFGLLDGRLGEDMYKAIEAYLKILKTASKAPQIYICDYEKGFAGSPRIIGKEEKIRREKIKSGEIKTYTKEQMKSGAEYCMMKLIAKDGNIGEITEEQRESITEILEEFYK